MQAVAVTIASILALIFYAVVVCQAAEESRLLVIDVGNFPFRTAYLTTVAGQFTEPLSWIRLLSRCTAFWTQDGVGCFVSCVAVLSIYEPPELVGQPEIKTTKPLSALRQFR